jgi:hypothetical protein
MPTRHASLFVLIYLKNRLTLRGNSKEAREMKRPIKRTQLFLNIKENSTTISRENIKEENQNSDMKHQRIRYKTTVITLTECKNILKVLFIM